MFIFMDEMKGTYISSCEELHALLVANGLLVPKEQKEVGVVEVAQGLAQQGHRLTVFLPCLMMPSYRGQGEAEKWSTIPQKVANERGDSLFFCNSLKKIN